MAFDVRHGGGSGLDGPLTTTCQCVCAVSVEVSQHCLPTTPLAETFCLMCSDFRASAMPSHDAMRPRERVPWQRPPIAGWQGRTGTPPGGGMWDNIPDISKATTHLYADKNQVTTTGLAWNNARTAF